MAEVGVEPTRERVAIAFVLGLACTVGGAYLIFDGYSATVTAEEVDATVLESSVSSVSGVENEYRVHVRYEYTYEGDTYTSDNVFPGAGGTNRFSSPGTAEDFIADYPEGETVTAHVNPSDPSEAHLESGVRLTSLLGFLALIAFGVVALAAGVKQFLGLRAAE